jgi:hypothetical protein
VEQVRLFARDAAQQGWMLSQRVSCDPGLGPGESGVTGLDEDGLAEGGGQALFAVQALHRSGNVV